MAFQGFARQEDFSTNQIKIDIGSVIDSDLAEAKRISKWHGRNAEFGEKWRGMYLDAMINKHEVEKRNREDNFNFFMENREAIQKQVEYNNSVKAKDAERSHPHVEGLDSILGKGLLQLAVNLGGSAIKGAIARSGEAAAEAKAKDLASWKALNSSANQSPEHRKELGRLTELVKQGATEQVEAALASPDNIFYGDKFVTADNIAASTRLTLIEKQQIEYSTENVARNGQAWAEGQEIDISGAPFTLATIGDANQATQDVFFKELRERFHHEFLPNDLNQISQFDAAYAYQKLQDRWQATGRKTVVKNAKLAEDIRINRRAQIAYESGGVDALYQEMVKNGSSVKVYGRAQSIQKLGDMLENELLPASALRELMDNYTFSDTGILTLSEQLNPEISQTPSATALRFQEIADKLTIQEQRDQQIEQIEIDNMAEDLKDKITSGMDQQEARGIYYSLLNGEMSKGFQMVSKGLRQDVLTAAANAAGITEAPQVVSIGDEYAEKLFTKTEQKTWVGTLFRNAEDGKGIDLSTYTGPNVKKVQEQGAHLFKDWVAGLIDSNEWDPRDPRVKGVILNKLSAPDDPDVKRLTEKLQIETKNPETKILFPDGPRIKGFTMPTVPSDGVKEYNRLLNRNPGTRPAISEVNYDSLEDWARNINTAGQLGGNHQQNALGRRHPLVDRMIEKNPLLTPGAIYNAAVKHFKEQGVDYQPLPESQFLNQGEMSQLNDKYGSHFKGASQPVKAIIAGGGQRMNAATIRGIRSNYVGSDNIVDTGLRDYKDRPVRLSPQAARSFQAMIDAGMPYNPKDVASVYRDEDEYLRLSGQGLPAAHNSAHNFGEAMDVHGNTGRWIQEYGSQFGWNRKAYGRGDHGGHIEFTGWKGAVPSTVPTTSLPSDVVLTDPTEVRHAGPGTPGYGHGGTVDPDKQIPTGLHRTAAGVGDAVLNSLLPGNPFDLDRRGN